MTMLKRVYSSSDATDLRQTFGAKHKHEIGKTYLADLGTTMEARRSYFAFQSLTRFLVTAKISLISIRTEYKLRDCN